MNDSPEATRLRAELDEVNDVISALRDQLLTAEDKRRALIITLRKQRLLDLGIAYDQPLIANEEFLKAVTHPSYYNPFALGDRLYIDSVIHYGEFGLRFRVSNTLDTGGNTSAEITLKILLSMIMEPRRP